jgi:ribosomal protein S18 acetylase RimI-like enzyme
MTEVLPRRRFDLLDGEIAILHPEDVRHLQVGWNARYARAEIESIVAKAPALSLWNTRTGGYLIATPWRHRDEIANVLEFAGPSTADDLLRAFIAHCSSIGFELAVVAEYAERRRETFYYSAGMSVLEDIIVYELGRLRSASAETHSTVPLTFRELSLSVPEHFGELLELDHRAFPWLWWNSEAEFVNYAEVPGVSIEGAFDEDGSLVGYIGTTAIGSWGHLDRIAVDPDLQGRGYGRRLLEYSMAALGRRGARRIALSTQSSNTISRALYESVDFRRARAHDYRIYGRWLQSEDGPSGLEIGRDE